MPDPDGDSKAGEDTTPATPLHAYKEGRDEDIAGDTEKFLSDDRQDQQQGDIDDEESSELGPPAHEKS
jgi:hypothetical protein